MSEKRLWGIKVVIEATPQEASEAEEAIGRALCPDENHPGYCPVPWTTLRLDLSDLDDDERAEWQPGFDEQREAARQAGEDV